MRCSVSVVAVFIIVTILYGSSYAVVSKGLVYFSAGAFQTLRMTFALVGTIIILIVRTALNHNHVKDQIKSGLGLKTYVWLCIGGLINLGVPHCLIAVAQKWVSSASVQLMQPFSTTAGAIFGHFFFADEPFNWGKFNSLILSLFGVALTGAPSFLHAGTGESSVSMGNLVIGYALVIVSIIMFGVAPGVFKLKAPNVDITLSVCVQLFVSALFCFIWSLVSDGPSALFASIGNAPAIAFVWPLIVGVLVSCLSVHGLMYLINEIGTFGSNLMPFGQIMVGVIVGVAFLNEWAQYKVWEIIMCCVGILFLCSSMYVGFRSEKKEEVPNEEEEKSMSMSSSKGEEEELVEGYPMPAEL